MNWWSGARIPEEVLEAGVRPTHSGGFASTSSGRV